MVPSWLKLLPRSLRRRYWLRRLREARRSRDRAYRGREEAVSELHQMMYTNIGVTVVAWSEIEKCLDTIIDFGHFDYGEDNIRSILPAGLDRELDYVKRLAKGWPLISGLSDRLLLLCRQIHEQKEYRHNLVHGWVEFSETEWFVATLPQVSGPKRLSKRTVYTSEKVLAIARKLERLLREVREITTEIAKLFVEQHRELLGDGNRSAG